MKGEFMCVFLYSFIFSLCGTRVYPGNTGCESITGHHEPRPSFNLSPTDMFLGGVRKSRSMEETHMNTTRTFNPQRVTQAQDRA